MFLCFIIPGEWNPQPHPRENLKTYMFICLTNLKVRAHATNWINGSLGPRAVPYMVVEKKISDSHWAMNPNSLVVQPTIQSGSWVSYATSTTKVTVIFLEWLKMNFLSFFTDHTVPVTTSSSSAWKTRILLYLGL